MNAYTNIRDEHVNYKSHGIKTAACLVAELVAEQVTIKDTKLH